MKLKTMSSKKKWILIAVAVLVVALLLILHFRKKNKLAVSYREVPVTRTSFDVTILSTGVVQPENRLEIKPPIAGRAEEVLVKEGDRVRKGQILAWMSSTERAALLDAARAKGADEVKRWQELYKATPILAPISGMIIQRNIESGQTFTNSDAVLVMSDRLTVKAQVDETDISQVHVGQNAGIILDAYPNNTLKAHVDQIAFDATTVNNVTTYVVDVLPEETPDYMRSGMTANVSFLVASLNDVLAIPTEAIKVRGNERYVLMSSPDGRRPVEKNITVGQSDGKLTEIKSGLNEGDQVLIAELSLDASQRATNPFFPSRSRSGSRGRGAK
jgi:macrolide-specific efflux system membrane fusion protein